MADTLCFIPCCKKKAAAPDRQALLPTLTEKRIPETWQKLQTTRNKMGACVDEDTRPRIALRQYNGGFYNSQADFREDIARNLNAGRLDLYIISAGYGIVHALDPIHPYEAEMKGRVATLWRDMGLSGVISELISVSCAQRVFGFFAAPSCWSGAHAKYRYFFTEGVKTAIADGATLDTAACFYCDSGRGTNTITGALGRTLLRGLHTVMIPEKLTFAHKTREALDFFGWPGKTRFPARQFWKLRRKSIGKVGSARLPFF